jgi:hypothetical protein
MLLYYYWNRHIELYADIRYVMELTSYRDVCHWAGFTICSEPTRKPIPRPTRTTRKARNNTSGDISTSDTTSNGLSRLRMEKSRFFNRDYEKNGNRREDDEEAKSSLRRRRAPDNNRGHRRLEENEERPNDSGDGSVVISSTSYVHTSKEQPRNSYYSSRGRSSGSSITARPTRNAPAYLRTNRAGVRLVNLSKFKRVEKQYKAEAEKYMNRTSPVTWEEMDKEDLVLSNMVS